MEEKTPVAGAEDPTPRMGDDGPAAGARHTKTTAAAWGPRLGCLGAHAVDLQTRPAVNALSARSWTPIEALIIDGRQASVRSMGPSGALTLQISSPGR